MGPYEVMAEGFLSGITGQNSCPSSVVLGRLSNLLRLCVFVC